MTSVSVPALEARSSKHTPLEALSILLGSRIALFALAYIGLALIPMTDRAQVVYPNNLMLDGWTRWDGIWYTRLADTGYTNVPYNGDQRDVVCFPLYAIVIRFLGSLIHDAHLAGIIISNCSFVGFGLLMHSIVRRRFGEDIARRTIVLLAIFPFSYTFSAIYTESFFLLLTMAAFWFGERRIWYLAALCAAAAGATRFVGIAIVPALALLYLEQAEWKLRNIRPSAVWLLLGFGGIAAYMLFLQLRFGDALAFYHGQQAPSWADFNSTRALGESLHQIARAGVGDYLAGDVPLLIILHLSCCVAAIVLSIIAWFKLPPAYAMLATLLVLISLTRWACFGRHSGTIFPIYIAGAIVLSNRYAYRAWIVSSIMLLALLTLMFTHTMWVA